jgi:hypothetical protein
MQPRRLAHLRRPASGGPAARHLDHVPDLNKPGRPAAGPASTRSWLVAAVRVRELATTLLNGAAEDGEVITEAWPACGTARAHRRRSGRLSRLV